MTLFSGLNDKMKKNTDKERRRSFGIGGAGNIRRTLLCFGDGGQESSSANTIYPAIIGTEDKAVVPDVHDLVERRRSRVNSLSIDSPTEERTNRRSSSFSETLKHAFKSSSNSSESHS
ncbi:hypothetical protein NPX13_g7130 [Xylaria arbuscula]|uniref:Uncharacterized protein n=1 Tax=Xylaria arbuscula TaxID=114810 RepID=A0A9W8TJR7_9PEZI|nr:hypothetical protein NPX13_g7130 [Xylaria arbuscula]